MRGEIDREKEEEMDQIQEIIAQKKDLALNF